MDSTRLSDQLEIRQGFLHFPRGKRAARFLPAPLDSAHLVGGHWASRRHAPIRKYATPDDCESRLVASRKGEEPLHGARRRNMRAAAALTIARAAIMATSLPAWNPLPGASDGVLTTSTDTAAREGRYSATPVPGHECTE